MYRIHAYASIHILYKLSNWIARRKDRAISRDDLAPRETALKSARVRYRSAAHNHIVQILTGRILRVAAGIPRIGDFSREPSIDSSEPVPRRRLCCRGCALSLVLCEVAHFCANVRTVGLILWTLVGYQIAAQIWHARYFVSPLSPRPHFPIFRSLDRIFCLPVDLREFVRTLPVLVVGKMVSRACSAKYGGVCMH